MSQEAYEGGKLPQDEEKSWFEKYMPNWFNKMEIKNRVITFLFTLTFTLVAVYLAFIYAKTFFLAHIAETIGILIAVGVIYIAPKTDIYKKFMNWLFIKHKNKKIIALMTILSSAMFMFDFNTMLKTFIPYIPEEIINNFIIVTFVYLMGWLYLKLFSEHRIMKYAKHFVAIAILVFFRAIFQHTISPAVEQLLNIAVLILMGIMLITYLYETFFVKDKAERTRVTNILQIVFFATLVGSGYLVNPIIAKERMSTIKFEELKIQTDTFNEVPVDERLATKWMSRANKANEGITFSDSILIDGQVSFIVDSYSTHFTDLYIPWGYTPTKGIKVLDTKDWKMKIVPIDNHSTYSDAFKYGHKTSSAVAKRLNPISYITDTTENTVKYIDNNGSVYSAELISTLSSYLTPYSVAKGLYMIKDTDDGYDFLFGAGEYVTMKDAVAKYSFLEGQQIVPMNVIIELVESVEYLSGYIDKALNKEILIPDRDSEGNIIIEKVYTTIDGMTGPYASIQMKAKIKTDIDMVNGKEAKEEEVGQSVVQTWKIPLFYTGSDELTVYRYDNAKYGDTYLVKSLIESEFLVGIFAKGGYKVFGKKSVVRNGREYILASRVKVNGRTYSMNPDIALYSFDTETLYEVDNPTEMEKIIKEDQDKR